MSDLSGLVELAFAGRAVLLAGQQLEPEIYGRLLQSLLRSVGPSVSGNTLADVCSSLSEPVPLIAAIRELSAEGTPSSLRHIADVPWAAVFTSALDDRLTDALADQNVQGRRLRHLCVDDTLPAFFPRRSDVLSVLHLAHIADQRTPTGMPAYGRYWGRIQRLLLPGVLKNLPSAIGPAHILCVAGIGANDLLDWRLVSDVAQELDPDNVYWFVSQSDGLDLAELRSQLPQIHFLETDLASALESSLSDPGLAASARSKKEQTLELEDLAVTVEYQGSRKVLTFRASELREFRRHLVVLNNMVQEPLPRDRTERRDQFRAFLARARRTPDWDGISQGYAFERDAYSKLLKQVLDRVNLIGGSSLKRHNKTRKAEEAPIFLAGPAASGRTVGLHWLGYQLRRRGLFTVHLLSSEGSTDNSAIEQIIRLAESRGAAATIVLMDHAERSTANNLDRHLRSAGRRTVVVAAVPSRMREAQQRTDDVDPDADEVYGGIEIPLDYQLDEKETLRFNRYLAENGDIDPIPVVQQLSHDPSLFALLYRLVPDARENIRSVLVEEYVQLCEGLLSFSAPTLGSIRGGTLRDQLNAWLSKRQGKRSSLKESSADTPVDPRWQRVAAELPRLVLLFGSLDDAISLNLLSLQFPGLVQIYDPLRAVLEKSGLFVEVMLDKQNDLGLTTPNQLVAQILLEKTIPYSATRIELLGKLLYEFPWDPLATPLSSPEQATLIHLIRSISPPSGAFSKDYRRTEDLRALAHVLYTLRQEHSFEYPPLMHTEGIILRQIGRELSIVSSHVQALEYFRLSHKVLVRARELLSKRPPSAARNFELSTVLNSTAATIFSTFRALSKALPLDECREFVQDALETANQSLAYAPAYDPLDTAFWTNRDFYNFLQKQPETEAIRLEKQQALLNMTNALDKVGELGEMSPDRRARFKDRQVELHTYLKNVDTAERLAEDDAKAGHFGGVCLLARLKAIDPATNKIRSPRDAEDAVLYLEQFAPRIFGDDKALALMHRLWVDEHLGSRQLDDGPYAVRCTTVDWARLERITDSRRQLAGETKTPYVNFWLAVARAHQGDFSGAMRILEQVQINSLAFTHRRLTPLIYLSDDLGKPIVYSGIVRRRDEDDLLTLYVSNLATEVKMPKRYQGTATLINVEKGDMVSLLIAFSYWNPTALNPEWEQARSR